MTCDVAIIGGGIVGAACAAALARHGLRTLVIDAARVGGGATAAGMGHVVVMDDSPAQLALSTYSQRRWNELAAELPASCEVTRCGTIWVAEHEEELAAAESKVAAYQALGLPIERLDAAALARWEPNLRPGLVGGLRMSGDSVVYPPTVAETLLQQAEASGGRRLIGRAVTRIEAGKLTLDSGDAIHAPQVVVAAGHTIAKLLPGVPVRPRKGHLVITDRHAGFVSHQLLELGYLKSAHGGEAESVAFNVQPRSTGQLLIGSSRQYGVESKEVELPLVRRMMQRALHFMPKLAKLSAVRVWTGFRAATPDGLPLVGPYEPIEGVYLATGHEGLGITTSLGTADLIAAQITGNAPPLDDKPFLPSRFNDSPVHL